MRIPEAKIEEIRRAANITDIISFYVQLRKRGRNFVGLCPFHQEKTPSFTVSEEKQIYHCFGCHAGGNVFNFLMNYKNISYIEAVLEVAEYAGISIQFDKSENKSLQSDIEILYDITLTAAKYYSDNLLNNPKGEIAKGYLRQRNMKPQTKRLFGLGYALPIWDDFYNFVIKNKVNKDKANELGLIEKREDGSYYDKFAGRLIFPIFSTNGRVIAFGGRLLDNDEKYAKYLNSPESKIYQKRKSLYGLYHSKDEIRRLNKAILVEGYMDLISLYQNGIKNVVASSGTSLTEEQVQLLSRFTRNIAVIFDADIAGQKATARSIELLLKNDFDIQIVELPDTEDPDSFINNYGPEEFEEMVRHSSNFLEFYVNQMNRQGVLSDPSKQTDGIREIIRLLSLISDDLKRNLFIKAISKKFNLREKLLESELDKVLSRARRPYSENRDVKTFSKDKMHEVEGLDENQKENKIELEIIKLLFIDDKEIMDFIIGSVDTEDIQNKNYNKIFRIVWENYQLGNFNVAHIIETITETDIKNFVLSLSLSDFSISKNWDDNFNKDKIKQDIYRFTYETVQKFKLEKIKKQIKINNAKIDGDESEYELRELLLENQKLENQRSEINKKKYTSDKLSDMHFNE
ncbi:MAG: DNA primase [Ignavibacteriales bacterium]|nr:DNA primase [Ignavibacteriales bacterium]